MTLPAPVTQVQDPTLASLLQQYGRDLMSRINCAQVGEIVTFDPDKQTAQVQLKIMRLVSDRTKTPAEYIPKLAPLLVDVPVFLVCGGDGCLTFPIAAGDPALVVFNDRDIDNWFETGGAYPPNSTRMHDLSDGFAFIGFRNKANALVAYNMDDAELAYSDGKLKINDKVALIGKDSTLRGVLEKVVDALTALNGKTGPSAATQITAVTTEIDKLLQP